MEAKTKYGRKVDTWDEGYGPLWLLCDSMGVVGLVRAQTREDAWGCCQDELLPDADPNDPDTYARAYDDSAGPEDLAEGVGYRNSGVPCNPRLMSYLYQEDLNGCTLYQVPETWLAEVFGITVTFNDVED